MIRALMLFLCAVAAGAQQTKWTLPLDGPGHSATLFPNEQSPTAVAIAAHQSAMLVDGRGNTVWKTSFDTFVGSPITVADLNGDARPELTLALANGTVVCLDENGRIVWQRSFNTPSGGYKHLVAADLLVNEGTELLVGFDDGWLNCLDAQGDLLWRFHGDRGRVGGIAVADVDLDGEPEIVFGTDNGHIYCLAATGHVEWRYDELAPYGRSGPNIADANNDGKPEVYITRSNVGNATCLMALDAATGTFLWRTNDIQQGYVSNAIVDLDGDGALEIVHADKGNFIYCENADGTRRWRTELAGRGQYWAPAVADVDGDGGLEIIASIRDASATTGASVFVLSADGAIESTIKAGGSANNAPVVGDLDSDGALELIVLGERPNEAHCFTWNKTGRVAWPSVRGQSSMTANGNVALGAPGNRSVPNAARRIPATQPAYWGANEWEIALGEPAVEKGFLVFSVSNSDGAKEHRIAEVNAGDTDCRIEWAYAIDGRVRVEARLHEGAQSRHVINDVIKPEPIAASALDSEVDLSLGLDKSHFLVSLLDSLIAEKSRLRAMKKSGVSAAARADASSRFRKSADRFRAIQQTIAQSRTPLGLPFMVSVDDNPWDSFDPLQGKPHVSDGAIKVTAYQNEFEDVALSLFNPTGASIDVRAQFFPPKLGQGKPEGDPELARSITLRRLLPVQTASGAQVWDALPELDLSRSITVPPGESRQLWLTINTHGLPQGAHPVTLYLKALGMDSTVYSVPVEITVLPIALPGTVYRKINWSSFASAQASDQAVRDMIDHGINVIYGPTLPTIPVDENGALASPVDWTAFDAEMQRVPSHFFLLWGAPAPLKWPGDAPEEGSDLHIRGLRTAIHEMNRHLDPMGFPYEQWAFYPLDEPWNTGFEYIPQFKAFCERIKAAEPRAQNYTDPAGATRVAFVEEFKDLIDVWQPEMNILKRDPALVKWFQDNAKHFWAYEATGPGKDLLPLGYYRTYAWLAWHFGTEGAGYWVYRGEDTWWPVQGGDWSAVYQTNEFVVPSRRWQADRDGVEDYRAFHLLREEARRVRAAGHVRQAEEAEALISEAIAKVVGWQIGVIDEITRHTREYEIDFDLLLAYRKRIAETTIALRALN
ncbi:MAG TPA: PQQ-binding-like beta-propeller repeat protein [Candidatus Hydrogenedentes bacterium]|nr:PQQ-binding-like beta-propeller repeat protein [Candidatus Hydrogenedentota bacterium]